MASFNQHQFEDLQARQYDLYAKAKYELILKYLEGKGKLSILNVGFGSGELTFMLMSLGHTVTNIEPVAEYIELAKTIMLARNISTGAFIQSSIEEFTPKELYDCVIATDVLEHIQDDQFALNKLISFTKPTGIIILTLPAEPLLYGYHDQQLGHYRRYTIESFHHICTATIKIIKARYFGWTLLPICLAYSKFLKKPYPVTKTGKNRIIKLLLSFILNIDKNSDMSTGTTLLIVAKKLHV